MGLQSGESFGGPDLQLGNEHAGGLADVGAGERVEFGPRVAVGFGDGGLQVGVEDIQQRDAGNFRGGDRAGQTVAIEVAGLLAKEVKGANVFPGEDDGHCVDGADLTNEHGGSPGGPASVAGVGDVDNQDRPLLAHAVEARTLAEGELQLVVSARGCAAAAERAGRGAVKDERDGGRVYPQAGHAGRAQTIGGRCATPPVDCGEEWLVEFHT